ncbi:hypothetical protein HC752_18590 [Vibrio sp. S9_S30]|uniref:hypothetical protein n=1 Tax=Vibrio sp. S9_S30 TaxID=2720226 RepID=UPI001681B1F2|nr:hypothetical protein [Vibrio sp. S9_S30]MBD1558947.1 hypothetical protein [Vibrio sp. S9_S30]
MTQSQSLSWKYGTVRVDAMGGMIGPTVFALPNGQQVSPFYLAPWHSEPKTPNMDALTASLRGEWPCVPFGYPMSPQGFPDEWQQVMNEDEKIEHVHGYSSNHPWHFHPPSGDHISLYIDYPTAHPVKRLTRIIQPDPNSPTLNIQLTVEVRRATRQPIALHTCFKLPNTEKMAEIHTQKMTLGRTHPAVVAPEAHVFSPHQVFHDLTAVPALDGRTLNAARVPFPFPAEELLQLEGTEGTVSISNVAEQYKATLTWDADTLPSVLLWYSNYGRLAPPWRGRNLCIGIEPICSPFGLSPNTARQNNPIAASGVPTVVSFTPDAPLTIRYQIALESLG